MKTALNRVGDVPPLLPASSPLGKTTGLARGSHTYVAMCISKATFALDESCELSRCSERAPRPHLHVGTPAAASSSSSLRPGRECMPRCAHAEHESAPAKRVLSPTGTQ